jgi:alkanesulfonate monooxygenase SsuD/methylene tetrahydromethanopterin reductase-like flavin-dependent oxidoreductase (luciferase family)
VRDLAGYRRTLTHGDEINVDLDRWRRIRTVEPATYESELETTAYFGAPEQCVQRIARLRDEHGIGYFGASMSFGSMEHSRVLRSMELFAREVMPRFSD